MGLKLTHAADYATRAMIHLACVPEQSLVLRTEIAETQRIPSSFMAKILRHLVRARLLQSARGVHGGFALARAPADISMLDIVEAIEGPLALTDCTPSPPVCVWSSECPACSVWIQVQDSVRGILGRVTLEDLVSAPRRHGSVSAVSRVDARGVEPEPSGTSRL